MEHQIFMNGAIIVSFDMDQDPLHDHYYQPDSYDDDQTATTASSPITPASDNSVPFSHWNSRLQESELDLSSWDATPDGIRMSNTLQFQPWNFGDIEPKKVEGYSRNQKQFQSGTIGSNATFRDDAIKSPRPSKRPRQETEVPLRFVSVTPDNILSGDIHRTQGEWKRGRPRLVKPAPKSKTLPSPPSAKKQTVGTRIQPPVAVDSASNYPASLNNQTLLGPVFDHLRVTTQERNFFASLFPPGEFH